MTRNSFSRRMGNLSTGLIAVVMLGVPLLAFAQDKPATPAVTQPAATTAEKPQEVVAPAPFVPLTQLPQIDTAATATTLPLFLNQVYKICIGAGAALAVIMIMIGGVQIMTSKGSVTSNEKAKSHIQNAILGLILVLAPTIVFGIINPDILKLNLNVSGLQQLKSFDSGLVVGVPGQFTGADTALWEHVNGDKAVDLKACTASKGTLVYECKKKDGSSSRNVSASDTCTADEDSYDICKPNNTAAPMSQAQCTATYGTDIRPTSINSNGNACNASAGFVSVPHGCCVGASPTNTVCCARPPSTTPAPVAQPAAQPVVATPPPANTTAGYGWALYMVPRGKTTPENLASKGPFTTSQACTASLNTFLTDNNVDVSGDKNPLCICSKTIASQPGCPVR